MGDGAAEHQGEVRTSSIDDPRDGLAARLPVLLKNAAAISFGSVVPPINERLRALLSSLTPLPVFQLTHEQKLGIPVSYPAPAEIGQDRLANAAAAHALSGSPAIVIASGTAVAFDIITRAGGYEGGIIAPGLEVTRRYLHERTAQLPLLDDSLEINGMIGRSTTEAMRIGTVVGFPGLIQALLDGVLAELAVRGEPSAKLFITGGSAAFLQSRLRQEVTHLPDITLRGLAVAWRLNHP